MSKRTTFYFSALAVAAVIVVIIWSSITQPGVGDLEGDFREVAFYRNENNTGPVIRIYAVTVSDTLWEEMKQYGEFMPHTKYGTTKVYYFRDGDPVPRELVPGEKNFPDNYNPYCLAKYEKDNMGKVSYVRYPLK